MYEVLQQQFDTHPRDDDERAIDERREPVHEHEQLANHETHRNDAEDTARDDDPELVRHRDGHQDRVDREHDIRELYLDDGRPECTQSEPRLRFLRLPPVGCIAVCGEVVIRQAGEVRGADR